MDSASPFPALLANPMPLVIRSTLEQLRFWVRMNPWFKDSYRDSWFEVETSVLEDLQTEYNREWGQISVRSMTLQPFSFSDRRFADKTWSQPFYGSIAALYLLNAQTLTKLFGVLSIDDHRSYRRLRFILEQTIAACAPSNFLNLNPEAQHRLVETQGASLFTGLMHLASDMQEGKLRQCDKGDYEVGVTLATTPGAVVYQNPIFQLIQYAPTTEQQFKKPILIVPPAINKFYILDLQPKNSMIRYLVAQGHPVFVISWRNADESIANASWDDYLEQGIIEAIRVTKDISGSDQINAVGYCVGGTLLCTGLAVLAARNDYPAASLTLLATLLDFEETGEISIFIDEELVSYRERTIGGQEGGPIGVFRGEDMANTFSLLRPNELWWNYSVDKYLKGMKPRSLDMLFWNNDSTNLPGPFYCYYLRHTYLQNDLKKGVLKCCGERVDLSKLKMPVYLLGTREDHIVPWGSAFANSHLLSGPVHFVLGASGHIAGVVNPPAQNKRSYWTAEQMEDTPEQWLAKATEHPGSWWPDWMTWLSNLDAEQQPSVTQLGTPEYPVLEAAPGQYVKS